MDELMYLANQADGATNYVQVPKGQSVDKEQIRANVNKLFPDGFKSGSPQKGVASKPQDTESALKEMNFGSTLKALAAA